MNINSSNDLSELSDSVAEAMAMDIRHLTSAQFTRLGVSQLAYVKSVKVEGEAAIAIHAADGTPMALAPSVDVAFAAIRQHDMAPALVH